LDVKAKSTSSRIASAGELGPASLARLKQRGETLVFQEISPLGLAPVFERGKFGAKPVSLRVFAAWTPNGWMVMPGGLTRVAADDTMGALSMQSGASSKDAWVLSTSPVDPFSLLGGGGRTLEIKRMGESAPSRAMDNLFWLGRYAERTENFVRILRAVTARLSDEPAGALEVARWLEKHPGVERVHYPFLESHPGHAIAKRQQSAGGPVLSFVAKGGREGAWRVIDAVQLISITANFGDVKSTICHPASTTHARLTAAERDAAGISEGLVRLGVGLEDISDIRDDLDRGLKR